MPVIALLGPSLLRTQAVGGVSLTLHSLPKEIITKGRWLLFLLFAFCGSGEQAQTTSTVESFKSFLSLNPAISNVVFERQVLMFPQLPGGVKPNTNEIQYYQAGRQSNGFYLRRLWSLGDADSAIHATSSTAGLLFAGKAANRFWHIVDTNIYYTSDPGNYVAQMSINAEAILSSVLDMGVENLLPGSLVWSGNSFTARSTSAREVRGSLDVSDNFPQRLTVQYQGFTNSFVAEYAYSKESHLPCGIPSRVHMALVNGPATVPRVNTTILSADIAKDGLPVEFLQPERFIESEKQEIVFTNGSLYLTRDGVVRGRMLSASMSSAAAPRHKMAVLIIYAVFATSTLLFIILLFIRTKKST